MNYAADVTLSISIEDHLKDDLEKYLIEWRRAIDMDPAWANLYNIGGILYKMSGNLPRALQLFRDAISLNPQVPQFYYNIAEIFADAREYAGADSYYKRGLKLNPYNPKAQERLEMLMQNEPSSR